VEFENCPSGHACSRRRDYTEHYSASRRADSVDDNALSTIADCFEFAYVRADSSPLVIQNAKVRHCTGRTRDQDKWGNNGAQAKHRTHRAEHD
jgi:hypothetical protein